MRTKHEVKPLKSWGSLPSHHITTWKKYNCDLIFSSQRMGKRVISTCNPSNVEMTAEFPNFAKSLPLIAIMAATTTRKIHNPSTKSLALFNFLLPSLIRSVDCGYRYEYVLGYDEGDPYYDSASVSFLCMLVYSLSCILYSDNFSKIGKQGSTEMVCREY